MQDKPNSGGSIVRVELTPAARENPPDPIEFIKGLVEQFFAECVSRRDDFAFRPFLETARVTREIKRLQTVPEQRAWGKVFEDHGCICCRKRNGVHRGCGMCADCYGRVRAWRKRAVREGSSEPDVEFKLKACDQEKLARLALVGTALAGDVPAFLQGVTSDTAARTADEAERHSAGCVICSHPRRHEIEQEFIHNGSRYGGVRAIARKYQLKGTASLYRHCRAVGLNAKRAEQGDPTPRGFSRVG